jgi:hypothetical protein
MEGGTGQRGRPAKEPYLLHPQTAAEVRQFYEETRAADDELRREENPRLGYEAFPQSGKPLAKSYLDTYGGELLDHGIEIDNDDD